MIGNGSEGMEEEREIDIFVTNKCNSNCIMCPMSEGSRRKNNPEHIEELKAYIRELPKDVEYINVTGGEPTLAGKDFLEIMHMLKEKFQHSGFQLTESHFENVRCRSSKRRLPHQGIHFQERRDLPDYHRKFQYHKCSADLQPGMEYEDRVNGRR